MLILGIDTSCDDTSVAIYDSRLKSVLSERVSTMSDLHGKYGGVVPEIAARQHLELLLPMLDSVFDEAGIAPDTGVIDLIAVTYGPGLIGGLLVGMSCAKALSLAWGIPFVGVNHVEGHLVSASLTNKEVPYPHIALVISGGHSEIYRSEEQGKYRLLGETRDDAAGELLDKVGRLLDIKFPAGKIIDEWTIKIDPSIPHPHFPRPLLNTDFLEFSFSGLKTAVLYFLKSEESKKYDRKTIGAELFRAAVDCLLGKAFLACKNEALDTLVISGGVASSEYLRKEAEKRAKSQGIKTIFPEIRYCTDNAAMIALAGLNKFEKLGPDRYDLDCLASLSIESK